MAHAYATPADLATQYDLVLADLPADIETRLAVAAELVDLLVGRPIDTADPDELAVAVQATAAQVYHTSLSPQAATEGITMRKIGDLSISYASGAPDVGTTTGREGLHPVARRYLWQAGLLFRDVDTW